MFHQHLRLISGTQSALSKDSLPFFPSPTLPSGCLYIYIYVKGSSIKMPVIFYFSIVPAPDNTQQFFPIYYISSFIFSALHLTQIQVSKLPFMPTSLVSKQLSLFSSMYMAFTFGYIF